MPQLAAEGLLAATFCDLDGYATPEAVVQTIRSGARGMPAFIDLTAAQLEDLLAYLRTL